MGDETARDIQARKTKPFMNSGQAAYFLGISARQLERMRGRGQGPRYRRHSRFVVYHVDDLLTWSESTSVSHA